MALQVIIFVVDLCNWDHQHGDHQKHNNKVSKEAPVSYDSTAKVEEWVLVELFTSVIVLGFVFDAIQRLVPFILVLFF